MREEALFLGIDPSTVATGWGIVNSKGELVACGVIAPLKKKSLTDRLADQYAALTDIVDTYRITGIACEDQHLAFNSQANVDTLKKLSHVAAIAMLVAAQKQIPLSMYTPSQWRKQFIGTGKATKKDSINRVFGLYGVKILQKHNDIAEGVGIAYARMKEEEQK